MPTTFLSHTHVDKPVVEPIAIRLREILGEENVFYDSWSIQPGDGIIDKMNEGLASPDFVFFFVSAASLKSNMVKLEWQNALYKATKGKTRVIPVRVDGSEMPPVLMQNLWIDLHANGIEAAITQIIGVIQGTSSFTPQHGGFSNLTWSAQAKPDDTLEITIRASHLMEPNPMFIVLTPHSSDEISVSLTGGQPSRGGFNKDIKLDDGTVWNGFAIAPLGGAITPNIPMRISVKSNGPKPINIRGLLHQKTDVNWQTVPMKA
jgi:hypothetical protein